MGMWCIVLFMTLTIVGQISSEEECSFHYLLKHLNITNDKERFAMTRPVINWKHPTEVNIGLYPYSIVEVIEKSQMFIAYFWVILDWKNDFISWDPDAFCGINKFLVPRELLWTPDFMILETIEEDKTQKSPYLTITSQGKVTLDEDIRLVSACRMKVHHFPFDTQKCNLTFTSISHTVEQVKFASAINSTRATDLTSSTLREEGDWRFLNMIVFNSSLEEGNLNFSEIVYEMEIKRWPVLYLVNVVLPVVFFLVLDIFSFFIADSRGDKLGFKVTVLLAISVMMLILKDLLPAMSNQSPLIVTFFIVVFAFMLMSLLETILITYLMELDSAAPPRKHRSCCTVASAGGCRKGEPECPSQPNSTEGQSELSVEAGGFESLLFELRSLHKSLGEIPREREREPAYWGRVAKHINRIYLCCYLLSVVVFLVCMYRAWTAESEQ
ncbi:5-hydroxytryptamine receptor 3A [Amia ocellicauda]|uniref:5-hydroxytryptamine receptor 3A n=1 Tax=Amia ocellicauda TaxID=2972642 RepID=UPI003464754E